MVEEFNNMELYSSFERGEYRIEKYLPKELKRPLLVTVKAYKAERLLKTIEVELPNTPIYASELDSGHGSVHGLLDEGWAWHGPDAEKLDDKIKEMIRSLK